MRSSLFNNATKALEDGVSKSSLAQGAIRVSSKYKEDFQKELKLQELKKSYEEARRKIK